jgi:hypothetical protein
MTTWNDWLSRTTNGASLRAIAAAIGKPGATSTIQRWVNEGRASAEGTVAIARAYGADPLLGLVAAGYLDENDLAQNRTVGALREATTLQLTEELMRRSLLAEAVAQQPA